MCLRKCLRKILSVITKVKYLFCQQASFYFHLMYIEICLKSIKRRIQNIILCLKFKMRNKIIEVFFCLVFLLNLFELNVGESQQNVIIKNIKNALNVKRIKRDGGGENI